MQLCYQLLNSIRLFGVGGLLNLRASDWILSRSTELERVLMLVDYCYYCYNCPGDYCLIGDLVFVCWVVCVLVRCMMASLESSCSELVTRNMIKLIIYYYYYILQ